MGKQTTIAAAIIALSAGLAGAANAPTASNSTIIVVSADESWEGSDKDTAYFRGDFKISLPEWNLLADTATVHGHLEDPQRIEADGAPLKFNYRGNEDGKPVLAEGEGRHMEYNRKQQLIKLTGDAKIVTDRSVMQSSEIRYQLDLQKLEAVGAEGVHIRIDPVLAENQPADEASGESDNAATPTPPGKD